MSIRKIFGAARNQHPRRNETRKAARRNTLRQRLLGHETLEDRRLLTGYIVDTLVDQTYGGGDYATETTGPDAGLSLREAIGLANANGFPGDPMGGEIDGDTITFDPALAGGTIMIDGNGELAIFDDVTIDAAAAPGLTVDGGGAVRIFFIDADGVGAMDLVEFANLTLNAGNTAGSIGDDGGAIEISSGDTVRIDTVTISSSRADDDGGGIFNAGGTLTILDSTIEGNSAVDGADGSGGGIASTAGAVTITDTIIRGNEARRAGGGIEILDGSLDADGLTLGGPAPADGNVAGPVGMAAPGNGGGLHVSGTAGVTLVGGTVQFNQAGREGGGLWNQTGATMTLEDGVVVSDNVAAGDAADDGGGGIFNNGGNLTIDGGLSPIIIEDNAATGSSGSGGGIFSTSGTVIVDHSIVRRNLANRAGGGIETIDGILDMVGTTIGGGPGDGNNATGGGAGPGNGGGIHISGLTLSNVTDTVISYNSAASEGGGLWNSDSGTMVIESTGGPVWIDNNRAGGAAADNGGGGIFNAGGDLFVDNLGGAGISISNNIADGAAGSGGGIFNDAGGLLWVDSATIFGNAAERAGGGIEDNSANGSTILNSTIHNNTALGAPGRGGGIHITGAGTIDIEGSTFSENTAMEGGGLWNSGLGTVIVTNSTLSGNAATTSNGGGIFNTDGGIVDLDSVTVTLNSGSGTGDGIYGGASGVTIKNTIVAQNPGGGTEANLSGTIDSDDFNLIGDPNNGTLTGDTINTIFSADALLLPLTGTGGPTETHLPAAGSPAIGRGSTTATVDQRGEMRPQGAEDDIGAVEAALNGFVFYAGPQAGDGNGDEFLIRNDAGGITGNVEVLVNGAVVFSQPKATTGLIVIRGSADDDTLVVDNSQGLIGAKILFDGDGAYGTPISAVPGGSDTLRLIGSTPATTTYNPGETSDAGTLLQEHNQVVQTVEFFGLEPIQVLAPAGGNNILNVAAAPLGVGFPQALNAANSINYSEGPNSDDPLDPVFGGALTGLITVDGFESLEFANFEILNIDAGAGSDEIHLNNPVTPNELGTINVAGGDPTAGSDTVTVNGTVGVDTIDYTVTGVDSGTVQVNALPLVVLATTEHLLINGRTGNDDLTLTTPAGSQEITFTPGATVSSASVEIYDYNDSGLLPMRYDDLGDEGTLTFASGGGAQDVLIVNGTGADDLFDVFADGDIDIEKPHLGFASPVSIGLRTQVGGVQQVGQVTLRGLSGDDQFTVPGNHPFAGFGGAGVVLEGGNPDTGSDVLDFIGSGAGAVTLDLAAGTVGEDGFAAVDINGLETVNIDAGAALTVSGTADNDIYTVTPAGAGFDGTFTHDGSSSIAFRYSGATSLRFDGGSGGTADQTIVLGDHAADVVSSTTDTITIDGSDVTIGPGIERVDVHTLGGDDVIDLDLGLAGVAKFVDAGSGDDSVNMSGSVDATIFGGIGNDTLIGSPLADIIFGGAGNDILIGGGGSDFQYGEDGNDIFGNPTVTADGVADDPGQDFNFGGAGFDNFIWEPGDGPDVNNGGDDGGDIFRFFGNAAANTFTLRAGGTPTHFNALIGPLLIDNHGIEDVRVDGQGGGDTFDVQDLFETEVVSINLLLGDADAASDAVTVAGRSTDDDLQLASNGTGNVAIEGLTYDVNLNQAELANDTLTVLGNQGSDTVFVDDGVQTVLTTTIAGGAGADTLGGWFNNAVGNDGPDAFVGAPIDQSMDGGDGDDSFIGNGGTDAVGAGAGMIGDAIHVPGTPGDDAIDISLNPAGHLVVTVNGDTTVYTDFVGGSIDTSGIDRIVVEGGLGDDTLTVDSVNGAIPIAIHYDGDQDFDALTLLGGMATSSTYSPGPNPGQGLSEITIGGVTQTVSFEGLEPVIDLVGGPLVVNANPADNAITYDQSPNNAAWGRVTIDLLESIEFANKTTLTINAGAGDDAISLNNPATPTGLTGITVNGGDPTGGSDRVIVSGTTGPDVIDFAPSSDNDAIITGAGPVAITLDTIESALIDGQGGADILTYTSPAGGDNLVYQPAATPDAGTIRGHSQAGVPFVSFMPLAFAGLDADGLVTILDAGGGRNDSVEIRGTSDNDVFDLAASGVLVITDSDANRHTVPIDLSASGAVLLHGLSGDDLFNIPGDHLFPGVFGGPGILVEGGNPGSGSDVLNFTGAGATVTVDLGLQTVAEAGFGAVAYSGIETLNADAGGVGLNVVATGEDDDVTVTVLDANSGRLEHGYTMNRLGQPLADPAAPLVRYTNTGASAINVDLAGGEDTLNVVGNALAQTFDVDVTTGTVAIDDAPLAGNDGTVTYVNNESLGVFGLEGDDTFDVTPGQIPVFIDGGDPVGSSAGDTINVDAGGAAVTLESGPENDEGGILVAGSARISYDHIEALAAVAAMKALILGTNADDDITVIARDASTYALADGVQDFTVSVNAGPMVLFLDTPELYVDAAAGDDDIVLRTPAPNDASWDVDVYVAGGAPSDGEPGDGDRLVLETPGTDTILYTPTGSDTGTLLIDDNNDGLDDGVSGGADSLITIGPFNVVCPGLDYTSDPGGVERLEYDGEAAGDSFSIVAPAGDDTITHTPGNGFDEGSLRVNTTLAVHYQNLGAGAALTVSDTGGTDNLVAQGTASDDVFDVAATSGAISLVTPSTTFLALTQTGVENLKLDGLDGNDRFNINAPQPYAGVDVFGGGPGGSDVLTVVGAAGTDEEFTVTPAFDRGDGQVDVAGGGALAIPYVGIEHVLLQANGGDTDNLTVEDDAADNRWTVDAGPIFGDRIQIDDRESIDFVGFNDVTLDNGFGSDVFSIHPANLVGVDNELIVRSAGNSQDVLRVVGTEANDTFTSDTDTITLDGIDVTAGDTGFAEVRVESLGGNDSITLALDLAGVRKVIDAGAGDDNVDASAMQDATIFGGLGDDILVGSPLADLIFGGSGNDTISGLGGDDTIDGGDGNDTITGGTGSDRVFGGADADRLIWNQGDGSDLNEGGTGNDVVVFNGATAAEVAVEDFTLSAQTPALDSVRILLDRTQGGVQLDIGSVEQIDIVGGTGVENVQVNELTHTDLQILNVDNGPDGDTESIRVEGRGIADDLAVIGQPGGLILGNQPDVVFVIDVSGSTSSGFAGTPVGDLNGDGTSDTILDAEIAGFIRLNQELIARGLGTVADVSIVAFNSTGTAIDLDPVAPGVQTSTTPSADADADGVLDVEQALSGLVSGGGTDFENALDAAISTFTTLGTTPGNGNMIFLSDGDGGGGTADEVATLSGMGVNIKAYGVGTGSSLPNLQIIDPAAFQFTTTDELITALGGGAGGVGAVALSGPIKVTGLQYDVNILRSNTTDADSLTVDGNQGDDLIEVEDGVEAVIVTTLEGGLGDDHLSGAFNTADGGDGDDFLRGSTGDQLFFGGTGEDTMVGGPGADTFDGGMGFDTILVEGFASDDRIDVRQDDATTLRHEVGNTINGFDGVLGGGGTETDTLVINTVEQVRIVAGEGDDTIRVAHDDALVAAGVAADMLRITVEGGAPGASDRLTVVDDGDGDTTVQRLGQTDGEGSFTMYAYQGGNPANPIIPLPPVVYSDVEYASLHPVLPVTGGTGDDGNGRLFVFKYDPFEQNQSLPTATFLGADSALNLDPNIDPGVDAEFGTPGDEDWYRVVAERTGTLDFQVYFHQQGALANGRAGLPGAGDLDIAVFDADGLVNGVPLAIAGSGIFGTNDTDDDERVRIPAVAGQTYYLRVVGAGLPAGDNLNASGAINAYNVSVVNDAPATPFDLELADNLTILTGDQEVPAVATNANGTANFQYDAAANTFDLDLFVAGLELADTTDDPELLFAHIHRGAVGANGPVIVTLSAGVGGWVQEPSGIRLRLDDAPFSGAAADIAALLAGDTYINVHSTANPGGEVRGQITIQNVLGVSDSGRSQFDNVTQDNTPTILLRLDDALLLNDLPGNAAGTPGAAPPDEVISIPHIASTAASPVGLPAGYRVAIYDETDTHNPVLLGFAQPIAGLNGVYSFTFTTPLAEGSHFISSRVQMIDPADNDADNGTTTPATGFGPRSVSMEIIVDTATPPVSFGDAAVAGDGLHPDSDSGDAALPATLVDRITNDTTPTFFGRAEANSIVRLYVDIDGNSVISPPDVLIGQTVAVPTDGTNQSPNGEWQITSTVNMNDPNRLGVLGVDGDRKILVQAEDQAGNLSGNGLAFELDIFIDTRGPQVTDVFITDRPDFDIFTLKPDSPEPTPRVDSLTINVQDLPDRVAAFLYPAISNLAVVPNVLPLGLVTLVGDHSGVIAATSVTFTSDGDLNTPGVQPLVPGNPATGFITMQFAQPLPDDRFTLTLLDSIIDPAGNALDGESNAAEPVGTPLFPSGDGLPGGDFVARFTVDSRPEVGVWSQELVYVDINGNMVWDPEGEDNDATNRDFIYHFGTTTDAYFAGNFAAAGAATASGFDKMGTFGRFNGQYEFFIDTDDDGIGDTVGAMFFQVNVLPVAGDFDPAHPGDEIGGFDGQNWYLDVNGDNMIDGTERFATELRGIPVVGDFNGDGNDDLATFNNDTGQFQFDLDRDGTVDDTLSFFFSGFGEKPVAGDVNLDGIDDIVLWVPNRDGQLPQQSGEFHFLVSDNPPAFGALPVMPPAVNALPSDVFDDYSPAPLGNDLISQFGDEFALPILGNFDPPVGDVPPLDTTGWFTNLDNPLDVDGSGDVTPYDALLVVNALNRGITSAQPSQALRVQQAFDGHFLDVDGNRRIDPTDVLQIINDLNRRSRGGQGEGGQAEAAVGTAASYAAAVDAVFADDEDEDELLLDWADNDALRSTL